MVKWKELERLRNIRRIIWNKRLKIWWYRIFIRKNEFHSSLDMDIEAMMVMDEMERKKYHDDIRRRRVLAHDRSLGI